MCVCVCFPCFPQVIQMSLDESYISRIWKTSTIVSVAKKRSAKELNEYRPVAPTSIPFKCAEKIVLRLLRSETAGHKDPFQFAYSKDKSTEDAILTLLHRLYDHLDKPKSYARVLFIDFSSAFSTMQLHLLVEKQLLAMSVNPVLIRWIFSFLQTDHNKCLWDRRFDNQHRCSSGMCAVSCPPRPVHSQLSQQRRRKCDG